MKLKIGNFVIDHPMLVSFSLAVGITFAVAAALGIVGDHHAMAAAAEGPIDTGGSGG